MGNSSCVSTNTSDNTGWTESSHDEPIPQTAWVQPRRHDVLTPCGSFDDVLSATRLNSDPILAALLTEVASGDQLAGRVVLQSLIDGWYGWRSGIHVPALMITSHGCGV